RPDDGVKVKKSVNRNMVDVDNRYVVPYNAFLLNKYGCHINVEAVTTVDVVKYIYKYIYKGFDRVLMSFIECSQVDDGAGGKAPRTTVHSHADASTAVIAPRGVQATNKQWKHMMERTDRVHKQQNIKAPNGEKLVSYDEAVMVEAFRFMTSSEAAWIIQKNPLSHLSHCVVNLSVHAEGEMPVFFRSGEESNMMERVEKKQYMYYKWEKTREKYHWVPYTNNMEEKNIVRVRPVNPRFTEAFATRLLAMHQKGPCSWEELRIGTMVLQE
ncbi:hypothetical protein PMAYCL1PPCAC_04814, partial [Pristionchus mayeri]